jgi:Holliday junction resolvase RusA-like endonuclease
MSNLLTTRVVVDDDGRNASISFVVAGSPPVQQRPRMNCEHKKWVPTYYDPSKIKKKLWKEDLVKALTNNGISSFPFFKSNKTDNMVSDGLRIECVFHISRRRKDYRSKMSKLFLKDKNEIQKYPATKDTDNMMKFVMDAYHDVLYDDDKCVVTISATKKFLDESERESGPYTTIRINTI